MAPPSLLQQYLVQIKQNPLQTKALTSGCLAALQEVVSQRVEQIVRRKGNVDIAKRKNVVNYERVIQMFLYGFAISGPLAHYLNSYLAKFFATRKGNIYLFAQILAANVLLAPIQNLVFALALGFINNRRKCPELIEFVKSSLPIFLKTTWLFQPPIQLIAYKILPPQLWSVFFNLCAFSIGTILNIKTKLQKK